MATDTAELLKKVRRIELKTKGLSNQIFSGEYHSAFKGRGMAFSEVREYAVGDEVRTIDWNVTARFGHPYVKIFEEERELTVILVVDVSASDSFGSTSQIKKSLITEICAVLAFSAITNNDKIGVIFFSNKVEKFITPKKGKSHILRIIRELIEFKPEESGTNISEALRYLNNVVKKRSIAFLISDFMDTEYEDALKLANKKHDMVALRIHDKREAEMPNVGMAQFTDPETGEVRWVNTSSRKVREAYHQAALNRESKADNALRRAGIDTAAIATDESYIQPLRNLFSKRS
ncbi:DUF58 domain-containing protein [Cryomorphaceae bacterium 1068]|nr:DUF58 domain-containing protein [Cryomorphaceae bacterium 1068]